MPQRGLNGRCCIRADHSKFSSLSSSILLLMCRTYGFPTGGSPTHARSIKAPTCRSFLVPPPSRTNRRPSARYGCMVCHSSAAKLPSVGRHDWTQPSALTRYPGKPGKSRNSLTDFDAGSPLKTFVAANFRKASANNFWHASPNSRTISLALVVPVSSGSRLLSLGSRVLF